MKKNKLFVLIAMIVGLGVGYIHAIDFFSPPYGASFLSWEVVGSDVSPALVGRGGNLEMKIKAAAPFDTDEFHVRVFMVLDEMAVEYPISEEHFGLIDAALPLKTGETFTCKLNIPIPAAFPPIPLKLYVVFEGQNQGVIAGGGIDVQIIETTFAR